MNDEKVKLKPTFKVSVQEGIFAQIFTSLSGAGSPFLTRLFVALGASSFQFGVLSAIGQFSQIFQILGAYFTRHKTFRKRVTVDFAVAGRVLAVLFGLLPFILDNFTALWTILSVFFISVALQAVSANAWIAWVSDIFPLRIRGRFFGRRNQYLMLAGVLAGYIFGFLMDLFDAEPGRLARFALRTTKLGEILGPEYQPIAFAILFIIAAAVGLYGLRILNRQPERPKEIEHEPFIEMVKTPLRDRNFQRLLFFGIWWMLAIGIGAPFWQPFMIKTLKMSLVEIMLYGSISTVGSLLALRYWGKIIDSFGNKTTMRVIIVLGSLNSGLWLFVNESNWQLVLLEAFFSGVMWSGAGLISINFVLAIAPKERKQMYSALYAAFSGIGMMLTMLLSGAFMPKGLHFSILELHPEQVLFGLTTIARMTAQIPLNFIRERRSKSVGDVFYYMRSFAKVQLSKLAWWRYK